MITTSMATNRTIGFQSRGPFRPRRTVYGAMNMTTSHFDARQRLQSKTGKIPLPGAADAAVPDARMKLGKKPPVILDARQKILLKKQQQTQQQQPGTAQQSAARPVQHPQQSQQLKAIVQHLQQQPPAQQKDQRQTASIIQRQERFGVNHVQQHVASNNSSGQQVRVNTQLSSANKGNSQQMSDRTPVRRGFTDMRVQIEQATQPRRSLVGGAKGGAGEDAHGWGGRAKNKQETEMGDVVTLRGGSIQKHIDVVAKRPVVQWIAPPSQRAGRATYVSRNDEDSESVESEGREESPPHTASTQRSPLSTRTPPIVGRQAVKRTSRDMERTSPPVAAARPPTKLVRRELPNDEQADEDRDKQVTEYVSPIQGFRLLITNLISSVTQEDIIELFGVVGPLKKARVVKSGTAEVVFVDEQAALKAVKKYHQRELDGQAMQVVFQGKPTNQPPPSFKLPQSTRTSGGESSSFQPLRLSGQTGECVGVDMDVIHRALFKSSSSSSHSEISTRARPVNFTVHM